MAVLAQYIQYVPQWVVITLSIFFPLVILSYALWFFIKNHAFKKAIWQRRIDLISRYSVFWRRKQTRYLVKLVRKNSDYQLLRSAGLNKIWIHMYERRKKKKILRLILEFFPEEGLFPVFQAAGKNTRHAALISESVRKNGIRMLAFSCRGENFNGRHEMFTEYMDEIQRLSGDPEWNVRYFSMKIVLENNSERSSRILREMIHDPHPLIRKTVIGQASAAIFNNFGDQLQTILLRDPVFEVRKAAWKRMGAEFPEACEIDLTELNTVEIVHYLDFLDPGISNHMASAIHFLCGKNLELRYPAAVFLERQGWLLKTLNEADFNDREDFQRRLKLLEAAVEVQVDGFIHYASDKPDSIYLALKLLMKTGDRIQVSYLAERALNGSYEEHIWKQAIVLINARPSDSATALLIKEFDRRRHDAERIQCMLEHVKIHDDKRVTAVLIAFLTDPAFSARETLIKTISRADVHLVLPDLYDIIRQRKKEHEHIIRVSALRIVATYQLPYFMQTVLEQLSRLSVEQASDFTRLLSAYPGKEFAQRVDELLEQNDSKIRAMLMMSLPPEEKKRIYPHIEIALTDSDPDVRIAAITAHVEVSQQGYPDLLRDPVTRVRETAACVMGKYADKKILHQLRNLVSDENEEEVVKIAAVSGIASSADPLSIHLLVDILADTPEGDALYDEVCRGLQSMTDTARLRLLIAELKNAEVALRKKLVAVFVSMKEDAEPFFVEVLKNDSISLRSYIIETLEKSGYLNSVIRRLTQRDVNVRRDAAEFLLLAGTFTSYRGLIQACRDPDEDIRILVTRALDYLASEDGRDILAELRSDPSRRVRRYTHWALERFEARK